MQDLISRQAAIEAVHKTIYGFFGIVDDDSGEPFTKEEERFLVINKAITTRIKSLPSAQPERLTDDDFETIRIHLNAFKEKLCNQQRWEEAEEYQRIIDRLMAFASAQQEIVRCKKCKYQRKGQNECEEWNLCGYRPWQYTPITDEHFCNYAERRTDE